jgi:hypothetical protein
MAPPLALVAQKTMTLPLESTPPPMSGGSVVLVPVASMIRRGPHETWPEDIGAASGVPSQYVTPDQLGPFNVVSALNTWILPVLSSIAI